MATPNITNDGLNRASEDVRVYDFQQAGRLNETQIQTLAGMHDGLVRNLTYAVSNHLRTSFELKLEGIEDSAFSQVVSEIPAASYVTSIELRPQHTVGGIFVDLALAFPMLDLLLGGPGGNHVPQRGLSEIEEYLMQDIVRVICGELELAWKSMDIGVSVGEQQKPLQLRTLLLPSERMVVLRLGARLGDAEGMLKVFFPVSTAGAMLRKVSKIVPSTPRGAAPSAATRIQERLMDCLCSLELNVPGIKVSLQELLYLRPGKLLDLGIPANTPAQLTVEGHEWFESAPVRAGSFRAAKLAGQIRRRQTHNG
ncbi:MAG TPA: FliM/FliN family flagellar motor switch protein [Terriglobales bacterium]|nr:FliM/FliN family flagellar motor switch protein [Terriglobales bacterium]